MSARDSASMASQSPAATEDAEAAEPVVKTEEVTANEPGGPVSNEDLKVMKGVVDYLTEYRDAK